MSWLNSSLNTIKGQLTTLAQEVLAETAGPGDDEYRGPPVNSKTALELLAETQQEKEKLDQLCSEKETEIVALRKQITELQNQIGSAGGSNAAATADLTGTNSGRSSNTPTDNNAVTLEDSWCWEPESARRDNDHSSETSSGNGNEMVNITLEEVPLGSTAKTTHRRWQRLGGGELQKRIHQLEEENKQLSVALDELDSQHNLAMQNVLELKMGLQEKLSATTKDFEALKKERADQFIKSELELGRITKKFEALEKEHAVSMVEKQTLERKVDSMAAELKRTTEEMADLEALLHKKTQDNVELVERVKSASQEIARGEEEREKLMQKTEQLVKEIEELKTQKEKKTPESSRSSSTGKHSEDEFIVVREGDANSSGPATPPTKEELKDRIVQLENRVSELTLENGSLALKLQDHEMEKELSVNVLKENIQTLQKQCDGQEQKLKDALLEREGQQGEIDKLREKAAEAIVAQEQLRVLKEEKVKIEEELRKTEDRLNGMLELEKRLLLSEKEKESLQIELQSLRTTKERLEELEQKIQALTLENQELKLNAEAETETLNNSAELEEKIGSLSAENESLRAELEALAQPKFHSSIVESKKHKITDLDADEEDDGFSLEKLRLLLEAYAKQDLSQILEDNGEKVYRTLSERLLKIESLEKNIVRMSEEMLDLQDSKLVWDHEKKTLEADISQYMLQCDELMKNNEILLNELENYKRNKLETIPENNEENLIQLEAQLEECNKLNRTLEEEYIELNEKIEEIEREKQELTEKLRESQRSNERLKITEKDMSLQVETLELEKCNLLFELNEFKSANESGNADRSALEEAEEKCQSLENQLTCLSKDHADLVAAMQAQKAALVEANRKRDEYEKALRDREVSVKQMEDELTALLGERKMKEELTRDLEEAKGQNARYEEKLLEQGKLGAMREEEMQTLLASKVELETQLAETRQMLDDLREECQVKAKRVESLEVELEGPFSVQGDNEELQRTKEAKETLEAELQTVRLQLESLSAELESLKKSQGDGSHVARIAQLESELLATADLRKSVDALNFEKNEMIKALQQKHSENMQYYMEIQRLTPLLQQLQQQQQQQQQQKQEEEVTKACDKCSSLESTVSELRREEEKLRDQINFLKEKSDILTTNLLTEQTNQRLVQQEKAEVEEQNAAIRKDLERLREHLLDVEEMHTRESVEMQQELEATKAQMATLQEEVSKSSTAYTSASIRANQHAETLQAQYGLVVQQRDELVGKLSLAEDRELRNQAALTNLQCALEQFQNDKENDIKVATQRIRKELQLQHDKESQLKAEIGGLQQQLAEANQGLLAASRLSDQLEFCQQTIAVLREEVESLKRQKHSLEEKLNSSESSQTDKIDKSLIKSLLIGYLVSGNPNDKQQILRMISSVLDFTPTETDKVGLNKQQTSWLGALLGGASSIGAGQTGSHGSHSRDNLVHAFVQFLEQESQPKASTQQLPNLLNITQSGSSGTPAPSSRRTSIASNGGATTAAPVPIQPLFLNSSDMNEFAPSRNSSSILKDILSDS